MEGKYREPLVKVSVVTGDHNIEAVVWRREQRVVMSEQDVDDVAFLTGTSSLCVQAQITHTICQSSSLIHNPCDPGGGVVGTESPAANAKKPIREQWSCRMQPQ